MRYKLIILDFDGTLGDTRSIILKTMQQTIAYLGLEKRTDEECAAMIGLPLKKTFTTLIPMSDAQGDLCAETYRRLFDENNVPGAVPVFPNVLETISQLSQMGCMLTIASSRSTPSLRGFIRDLDLEESIKYVVSADDVQHAKPHPEPVTKTMEALGFTPEETLVVGDTVFDILMGQRAGAHTVGVTYGNGSLEEMKANHADYIIDDFAQLACIVKDV